MGCCYSTTKTCMSILLDTTPQQNVIATTDVLVQPPQLQQPLLNI